MTTMTAKKHLQKENVVKNIPTHSIWLDKPHNNYDYNHDDDVNNDNDNCVMTPTTYFTLFNLHLNTQKKDLMQIDLVSTLNNSLYFYIFCCRLKWNRLYFRCTYSVFLFVIF